MSAREAMHVTTPFTFGNVAPDRSRGARNSTVCAASIGLKAVSKNNAIKIFFIPSSLQELFEMISHHRTPMPAILLDRLHRVYLANALEEPYRWWPIANR